MPKILIVDDEWLTRLEIEGMLTDLGYGVAGQAETGAEAVAMARKLNPDLILMDVAMPGEMNGIDAARVIKAELGTPIVFISGYGDPEYIEAAKEIAPFGYVMKPFDGREVHAFVEIALSRRKLELKLEESEEKYRTLVEANPYGFDEIDSTGIITYTNATFQKMLGYTGEELSGKSILNLFHPAAKRDELREHMSILVKEQPQPTTYFQKLRTKDGRVIDIEVAWRYNRDNEGRVVGFSSIITDVTERKRVEETLRVSEELHKEAQRVAHIGHWELYPEIGTPVWSDEIFRIFGLNPQEREPSFTDHETHLHPDDWPLLNKAVTLASTEGTPFDITFRIVRSDGEIRWMHAIGTTTKDEKGKVTKVFGTAQDITEHKRAEEALRESEEKFRLLSEQNLLGIIIIQDDLVNYANKVACEITGYSIEEVLDWKPNEFGKLFHPDDLEFVMEQAQKKQQGAEDVVTHYSYRMLAKSGKVKWVDQYSKTITFGGKTADLVTIIDITERKRAEDGLRESEEKYRQLSDSLPQIVFKTDEKGNLTFTNCAAFDILGYTREDFEKGLNALQMLIPEDHDRALKNIQRVLEGEKLGGTEYTALTKDGRRYPAMVYSTPIISEGKSVGMRGIVTDLTEVKRAQKALLESEEKLARSNKMEAMGGFSRGHLGCGYRLL